MSQMTARERMLGRLRSVPAAEHQHIPDRAAIDAAMHQLSHTTEDFAARRMDQSVKRALAGKKLEELDL